MPDNSLIPADGSQEPPHNDDSAHDQQSQQSPPPRDGSVMSKHECLRAIRSLSGAVAIGALSPAQANSMRASYIAILNDHYRTAPAAANGQLTDDGVLATLRRAPELLSIYRVFLTPEQLDLIMREFEDEPGKTEEA